MFCQNRSSINDVEHDDFFIDFSFVCLFVRDSRKHYWADFDSVFR